MTKSILLLALIVIAGIAVGLLEKVVKGSKNKSKSKEPEEFKDSYRKIDIMTRNEFSQYKKMLPVIQKLGMTLFTKVRLADLIEPTSDGKQYMSDFGRIKSKHCDFVICNSLMNVVAVIEIDDSSHEKENRKTRDKFLDFVLQDCGIKVLRYRDVNPIELENDLRTQSLVSMARR